MPDVVVWLVLRKTNNSFIRRQKMTTLFCRQSSTEDEEMHLSILSDRVRRPRQQVSFGHLTVRVMGNLGTIISDGGDGRHLASSCNTCVCSIISEYPPCVNCCFAPLFFAFLATLCCRECSVYSPPRLVCNTRYCTAATCTISAGRARVPQFYVLVTLTIIRL